MSTSGRPPSTHRRPKNPPRSRRYSVISRVATSTGDKTVVKNIYIYRYRKGSTPTLVHALHEGLLMLAEYTKGWLKMQDIKMRDMKMKDK